MKTRANNEVTLAFPSRSSNEGFARAAVSCFAAQMDPTLNEFEEGAQVHMNLFRGLYKFDQSNNLVPAMAEGYTLSEDETVYTFTLRDGLVWSDGSPTSASRTRPTPRPPAMSCTASKTWKSCSTAWTTA